MRTDQKCHLYKHFDNILTGGLEFQLPSYDLALIETIVRQPLDNYLDHKAYMKFLDCFSAPTVTAPWQAYPGHVPCSIPIPDSKSYQWDRPKANKDDIARGISSSISALKGYGLVMKVL